MTKQKGGKKLMRRFLPYLMKYKFILFFDLFCAALTTLCDIVLPKIMGSLTDAASASSSADSPTSAADASPSAAIPASPFADSPAADASPSTPAPAAPASAIRLSMSAFSVERRSISS